MLRMCSGIFNIVKHNTSADKPLSAGLRSAVYVDWHTLFYKDIQSAIDTIADIA